jgi:hypothetical protein
MDEHLLRSIDDCLMRHRVLHQFNQPTLDSVELVGEAEQQTKSLSEMISLVDDHEQFVKSMPPLIGP